jgi:hypothetical protein
MSTDHVRLVGAIIYSVLVATAFMTDCALLYFREIPESQEKYALILLGALIGEFRNVGAYWTGSTASSQAKDATIADIAKGP